MPVRLSYPVGMPCWIDCISCDPSATKSFYHGLFGWTFDDEGEGYCVVRRDGQVVAGLGAAPPGRDRRAFWTTYLASKNLDVTVAAVREYGGQVVMPPVAAGGHGRLFLALDPAGAAVGFWQGNEPDGIVLTDEEGAMTWHELRTPSLAILSFYRRLFELAATPTGPAGVSVLVTLADRPGFGIRQTAAGAPQWVPFFGAESVARTAERAVALGATVLPAADDDGSMLLQDPIGATFALRVVAPVGEHRAKHGAVFVGPEGFEPSLDGT